MGFGGYRIGNDIVKLVPCRFDRNISDLSCLGSAQAPRTDHQYQQQRQGERQTLFQMLQFTSPLSRRSTPGVFKNLLKPYAAGAKPEEARKK
jgi:hypothetical protein